MVTITIDDKSYDVAPGKNLLETCQTLGLELPYFCWHPAMGSVGSCRQCAVTQFMPGDDKRERGKIIMSCMTPVTDGLIVSLESPQAKKFRSMLIESTMTNHPHDCPVCEEAGECHLQDMTLMSGHTERRYRGLKRTHNNQYLGPFINHEMNRCIACYRCVRFYRDYAGGTDLNVFASRNRVYFGRAEDGVLENEFSGNLAEVCPTGVFTDKTLSEHYTRKWDLQSAPSVCTHCSVGCNIYPAEHKGMLRRVQNRFNPLINGHFICDRGRFGYGFVNHADRLTSVWKRDNASHSSIKLGATEAQQALAAYLEGSSVMAIGSARSSLENNFALLQAVGASNFYAGMSLQELQQTRSVSNLYQQGLLPASTAKSVEDADAALVIGEDITQTAPVIALSLRQMTRNAGKEKAKGLGVQIWQDAAVRNIAQELKSPLYVVNSHSTSLSDVAAAEITVAPAAQIAAIRKITALLATPGASDDQLAMIANTLRDAKRPVIVTGTNSGNPELLAATLELAQTLYRLNPGSGFVCALSQSNSMGLAELADNGQSLDCALEKIRNNPPETLVILETDLYRLYPQDTIDNLLDKIKNIVVFEHLLTPTAQMADLLMPTASFAEAHGSWINYEGRAQTAFSVFAPDNDRRPAWEWVVGHNDHTRLVNEIAAFKPCFSGLPAIHPSNATGFHIARKTIRATGRTATYATVDIREYPPASDENSSYTFSPEGITSMQLENIIASNASAIENTPPAYLWAPRWNSNEALGHFQKEANGPIEGSHSGLLLYATKADTALAATAPIKNVSTLAVPAGAIAALPYHSIFSDEELSGYVECMKKRAPSASVKMSSKTAATRQLAEGTVARIKGEKFSRELPVVIDDSVADQFVLLPASLMPLFGQHVLIEVAK